MDALTRLYASTAELYERFDVTHINAEKRRRIFIEEVLELVEASTLAVYSDDVGVTCADVANEAADVFVTVIGLLISHGLNSDDLRAAIERVAAKNDAKTAATHRLMNGKISRIS